MALPRSFMFVLVTLVALVAAACGDDGGEPVSAGDDAPDPAAACPVGDPNCADTGGDVAPPPDLPDDGGDGATPVPPEPTIVEPSNDTSSSRLQPWDEVLDDGDGDDTTHLVSFQASPEPCVVVDRVEVTESDTSVTVAVFTGPAVGSEDIACAAVLEHKAVPFQLDAPLGDREVLDPADADPEG